MLNMKAKMSILSVGATALLVSACSVSSTPEAADTGAETSSQSAAASTSGQTSSAAPTEARTIPVNVQVVAAVGVTVRVKGIELGTDATMLDISASYGGTITNDVNLAGSSTYLLDENSQKLMLKPPQGNSDLTITRGQTMEGKLVFLGSVSPSAKQVTLVFNDNNDGDSIIDPGLTIVIPLAGTATQ